MLRLRLTRQRYAKASQSFLCLCGETLFISFTLRSMLYNARTEQYLHLAVQIHGSTRLSHDSSKLCYSVAEHFTSQTLLVNSKAFQDFSVTPLHDAFACRISAFSKPISAIAFRFITRPLRFPGVLCPAFAQPFFVLLCLYSANFSLLYPAFATLIHFGAPHIFT